jgi:two-component sensor histidine kinase
MNISDPETQDAFEQTQMRVRSMALIHEKLYQGTDLAQVDVAKYLEELFTELVQVNDVADKVKYSINIPEGFELDLHTMVPIGLMMNELISNSFKHAFKGRDSGSVEFSIRELADGRFEILYSDDGVGIPGDYNMEDPNTLGVVLIDSLVEQLSGEMTLESNDKGTTYRIRFERS